MTSSVSPLRASERRRLDAWKAIADYLGRDVTTARRWEKHEGLPVHRHLHAKLGSVYAFTDEIDEWWRNRSQTLQRSSDAKPVATPSVEPWVPQPNPYASWRAGLGLGVMLVALAAVTGGPRVPSARAGVERTIRWALAPPSGMVVESLVVSPDAERVAFSARGSGPADLWVQQLDSTAAEKLPGTAGAAFPFWSPDGQHVGFFAGGRLKVVVLATREIRDLAGAPNGLGGTWNEKGDIVFAPDRDAGLMRMSVVHGGVVPVTTVEPNFRSGHVWPEFLPDGRHLLYTNNDTRSDRYGIYLLDLQTARTKRLVAAFSRASYAGGALLYVKGSLMAHFFDLAAFELRGEPIAVADRVLQWGDLAYHADFSASRDGVIVARSAEDERNKLVWVDRETGNVMGEIVRAGYSSNPTLSPDGKLLAVTTHETEPDRDRIWLFDVASGVGRSFTEGKIDFAPIWSPSSKALVFSSVRDRRIGFYERSLHGGGDVARPRPPICQTLESSTRDGSLLTCRAMTASTKSDVFVWRPGGDEPPVAALNGPANEGHSRLSPDGRFLAYASDESGRFEVYVRSFPENTGTWRASAAGGADPQWSRDGRELFFIAADRQLMVARVSTHPTIRTGPARPLFDTGLEMLWQDTRNHFDVTPDGRRFVVLVPESDRRRAPFTVILNWHHRLATPK